MARDVVAEILERLDRPVAPPAKFSEALLRRLVAELEAVSVAAEAPALGTPSALQPSPMPLRQRPPARPHFPGWVIAAAVFAATLLTGVVLVLFARSTGPVVEPSKEPTITTVDNVGEAGSPSLAIGAEGLPVIAYVDAARTVKVASCADPACSQGTTLTAVGTVRDEVHGPLIAVGRDGLPVVLYVDWDLPEGAGPPNAADLTVVRCADAACTASSSVVVGTGQSPSLAIGAEGLPLIAYVDLDQNDLFLVRCGDPACSGGTTVNRLAESAGRPSVMIGSDGLPLVAFGQADGAKLLVCADPACSTGETHTVVSGTNIDFDMAMAPDGRPVVSYVAIGQLGRSIAAKVIKCADEVCSQVSEPFTVSQVAGEDLFPPSVDFGSDGLPVLAFTASGQLHLLACGDPACSTGNLVSRVDASVGFFPSLAMGPEGLPVIAYRRGFEPAELRVAKCGNRTCGIGDPVEVTITTALSGAGSADGWVRVPPEEARFGGRAGFNDLIAGGPRLVAVGSMSEQQPLGIFGGPAVWTSSDGRSWTRALFEGQGPNEGGGGITAVTVGGPGLVAVGEVITPGFDVSLVAWSSADGTNWQRAILQEARSPEGEALHVSGLAAAGPGLVGVGQDAAGPAMWASSDGLTWSRVSLDEATFPPGSTVDALVAGGPGLVAFGSLWTEEGFGGLAWTSADGRSWARVPDEEGVFEGAIFFRSTAWAQRLAIIGQTCDPAFENCQNVVWTSTDASSWIRSPLDPAVFGDAEVRDLTGDESGLTAVGFDPERTAAAVWTSPDAIMWTRVPHDAGVFGNAEFHAVTGHETGLVSVGQVQGPDDPEPVATAWVRSP